MRITLIVALVLSAQSALAGDTYVNGYVRKDGTYVKPHIRSAPNSLKYDNYGSASKNKRKSGYSNPYTRDSDGDGIYNQYDTDDDNDGRSDESE